MTKIILADDHQLFIEGVRTVLEEIKDVQIIATVNNGAELMEKFRVEVPHWSIYEMMFFCE